MAFEVCHLFVVGDNIIPFRQLSDMDNIYFLSSGTMIIMKKLSY